MRKDRMTTTQIAEVLGVSDEVVRLATLPTSKFLEVKAIGKDGKARPIRYKPRQPKTVIATTLDFDLSHLP